MPARRATWCLLAVGVTLAVACGGDDGTVETPTVTSVKPACGDNAANTTVTVTGTLPAKPEIWVSDPSRSTLDTRYRAWVGDVELTGVTWLDATRLTAVVPAGIPVGTYALTVQSPFGTSGAKAAAFQVRQGVCPVETASLVITGPVAAPATVTVGQDLTVTATVQNYGLSAALDVLPSIASAPAGLSLKSAPAAAEDIPGSQARTFSWVYTATAPGGGVFVIDATGTASDTGLPVRAARVNTNDVLVSLGTFLTANTVVVPRQATVGQLVTAALTVTNHTTAAVLATPSIVVTGPVTAGNSPTAQSIPGGSSLAFQWTFTANAPGTASFTAAVRGFNPAAGAEVSVPTAAVDVTVQAPATLAATLSLPAVVELGDFFVTMVVRHAGGAGAASVVDVVPDQPTPRPGSSAGVVLASGPTGAPATVIAGQPAVSFTWTFTATSSGTLSLTSTARGRDANTGGAVTSAAADSVAAQVALHSIGGTIAGLAGTGLVLSLGGAPGPAIPAFASSFAFPTLVGSGSAYAVTVATQPTNPSQTCAVANGSGTVGAANVTSVAVTCSTNSFTVGGAISGLVGSGLVLGNNGVAGPAIAAGATAFAFPTPVVSGGGYAVTILAQPTGPTQVCAVAGGSGTVGAGNVTSVAVTCATSSFTVGGAVSGLTGTGLVLRNGAESLPVAADGAFAFPTPVASGGAYAVTVATQPTGPTQVCAVAGGSGTVGAGSVTSVAVTCATSSFTVGGAVSGLTGTGLVLSDNGGDLLPVTAAGGATLPFTFPTRIPSGERYLVAVAAQPEGQLCSVTGGGDSLGGGTIGGADVASILVSCVP